MSKVIFAAELMAQAALKANEMAGGRSWCIERSSYAYAIVLLSPTEEEESWVGELDLVPALPEVALGTAFKGFTVVCGDPHADVSIRYGLRDEVAEYRKVLRALLEP